MGREGKIRIHLKLFNAFSTFFIWVKMLQKSVDKQKRIGELNMIIATLSDFKLFWDLLDNNDKTPDNHQQDALNWWNI